MSNNRSIGIKGDCAYCNREMNLIAGNGDGTEGVCWQCFTTKDRPFYFVDGYGDTVPTEAGRAAINLTKGDTK